MPKTVNPQQIKVVQTFQIFYSYCRTSVLCRRRETSAFHWLQCRSGLSPTDWERERKMCIQEPAGSGCWRLSAVSGWKKWLRSLQCCTRNLVQWLCLPQLPVFCMEDTDLSANTCRLLAVVWQWSCGKCGATFTLKANVLRYQFESDFFFFCGQLQSSNWGRRFLLHHSYQGMCIFPLEHRD